MYRLKMLVLKDYLSILTLLHSVMALERPLQKTSTPLLSTSFSLVHEELLWAPRGLCWKLVTYRSRIPRAKGCALFLTAPQVLNLRFTLISLMSSVVTQAFTASFPLAACRPDQASASSFPCRRIWQTAEHEADQRYCTIKISRQDCLPPHLFTPKASA